MITVHLEDHGQDFLEWDIEDGKVIACRPFQEWFWKGTRAKAPARCWCYVPDITTNNGPRTRLRYPVEKVITRSNRGGVHHEAHGADRPKSAESRHR